MMHCLQTYATGIPKQMSVHCMWVFISSTCLPTAVLTVLWCIASARNGMLASLSSLPPSLLWTQTDWQHFAMSHACENGSECKGCWKASDWLLFSRSVSQENLQWLQLFACKEHFKKRAAPRQEHRFQEATLAARGDTTIVQMLLTGMMTNQPDMPGPPKSHPVTNGRAENKANTSTEPFLAGRHKPSYQFAEPQNTRNTAGPTKAGMPSSQAEKSTYISLARWYRFLTDLLGSGSQRSGEERNIKLFQDSRQTWDTWSVYPQGMA